MRPKTPNGLSVDVAAGLTVSRQYEDVPRLFGQEKQLEVGRYILPTSILDVTRHHLRLHGDASAEAALCWAGTVHGEDAFITTALLFTNASSYGAVHVSPEQTGLLYAHCHARGLTLLAQVHSHPSQAFHSPTDEKSPHSSVKGFLSVVIPNFGRCSFAEFTDWAVFEQTAYEAWAEWTSEQKRIRLQVIDSVVAIP
jgi:hypothetical protein